MDIKYENELTPREIDVINAIKSGLITDEAIAGQLNISKYTVITHLRSIYDKFDFNGEQPRAKLVWEVMR